VSDLQLILAGLSAIVGLVLYALLLIGLVSVSALLVHVLLCESLCR
jgi:hypothetical protein